MRRRACNLLAAFSIIACGFLAIPHQAMGDRVPVRAGLHQTYGRIVFDWPMAVGHTASLTGRTLTIRFERPIQANLGAVLPTLSGYVESIGVDADGKTVRALLKSAFRMRSFRAGNRVVIDLMAAGEAPVAQAERRGAQLSRAESENTLSSYPARVTVRGTRQDHYGRLVFSWPRKVPFTVDRNGSAVSIRFAAAGNLDIEQLRRSLPPQIGSANATVTAGRLEVAFAIPPESQLRYFHNGADVVFDVVAPVAGSVRPPLPRPGPATAKAGTKAKSGRTASSGSPGQTDNGPLVSTDAARRGVDLTVRFNWRTPVNAAVFRRDNALWIVFDKPARIDLNALRIAAKGLAEDIAQKPVQGGSAVRIAMGLLYHGAVRRDGNLWIVEMSPAPRAHGSDLPLQVRRTANGGAVIAVPAEKPGPVLLLADGEVGDSLYVVPLAGSGAGTHNVRRFAEFELLDSAQGLAVRPIDERLRVSRDDTKILISRPGGLTLSAHAASVAKPPRQRSPTRLLDLAGWLYGPAEDFRKIESELFQYVTQREGLKRSAARLGLARFYVAHGMGAEAIGVIAALEREDPAMLRDPGFRALRGIARYLIGHYAEASAEFEHPLLRGEPELDPWRGAIAAARGDWAGAHRLFAHADTLIAGYPPRFAVPLALTAAEAALSVDDLDTAGARLSLLESSVHTGPHLDRIAYLRGHLLKKQDETEKAIVLWQNVIAHGDRQTRAKATFALVNTLYDSGKMPLVEAIERLEQLRFAWRDDVFEFDLLQRLGALYAENKDVRAALVTLRQAATYFKDIKGAQELTQEMRRIFHSFYRDGDADAVAPVTALGLFDEFRELTPPGPEGDRMIRRLAERLVAVDLLSDAAELLDHLVRFRLKGHEKAETGARLAEILVADRKYDRALDALRESQSADADQALAEQRRYLAITAHAEAGRPDEALKLIGKESSERADLMRARIQWRLGNWTEAAQTLARLTAGFPTDKVDARQAEMLLRRAVALALSGNTEGVAFLRQRFGAAMEKGPRAAAFRAVVGRDPLKTDDFAALARQAAELDTFGPLLDKLRSNAGAAPTAAGPATSQTAQASN